MDHRAFPDKNAAGFGLRLGDIPEKCRASCQLVGTALPQKRAHHLVSPYETPTNIYRWNNDHRTQLQSLRTNCRTEAPRGTSHLQLKPTNRTLHDVSQAIRVVQILFTTFIIVSRGKLNAGVRRRLRNIVEEEMQEKVLGTGWYKGWNGKYGEEWRSQPQVLISL